MIRKEVIKYWTKSSDDDYKVMKHLFKDKDYSWALFIGHIVIEKILKAHYVKNIDENIPYTHNLVMIAKKSNLELTEERLSFLADLTTFNINARYDNYKANFKKKCTMEYSKKYIAKIEEFRKWLKSEIKK